MSSIYYPTGNCGTVAVLPPYSCKPCIDPELGRVRSVFLYKSTIAFINQSSTAEWTNYLLTGDVIVIKDTTGSYDGGTTTELPGFGDLEFINGGISHILVWRDPAIEENCDFYNALLSQTEYKLGWRTESRIWFSDEVANFTPKIPVPDDINGAVTFETTAKWSANSIPCSYATPVGIFDRCFAVAQ